MSSGMEEVIGEYVAECQEMLQRIGDRLTRGERDTFTKETLRPVTRDLHTIKGNSFLFGFSQIGQVSHAMEECLQKLDEASKDQISSLIDRLLEGLDLINVMFASVREKGAEPAIPDEVSRICDRIKSYASANPVAKSQEIPKASASEVLSEAPSVLESPSPSNAIHHETSNSIRVHTEHLDHLMNLAGELVLIRNQFTQMAKKSTSDDLYNMTQRLGFVTAEFQNTVMKTRMQPLSNILSMFSRIIRDTAKTVNKNVNLEIIGAETELDKSLIEAVRDPLTHIVRNAVDHGIEAPEDRKKIGKNPTGHITIRAYHEGGDVLIEVRDDGRGLNRMKISSKAIERGLMTPDALSTMDDQDIYALIFYPGFSTAAKVSQISGRGVGMDVVKTNIEQVGGSIEIASRPGKGTTFRLRLPLTLAIIPALLVRGAGSLFAIPQANLRELLQIKGQDHKEGHIEYLQDQPFIRLRGELLPIVDINKILLQKGPRAADPSPHLQEATLERPLAILQTDYGQLGLLLDGIEDSVDIVIKSVPNFIKELGAFSGATVLGDGSLALTLDITGLGKLCQLRKNLDQESVKKKSAAMNHTIQRNDDPSSAHKGTIPWSYLRIDVGHQGRYAIPLSDINRLEEISAIMIQKSGRQLVVKYRDDLLPLVSVPEALGFYEGLPAKDPLQMVVVSTKDRLYGLVVSSILDIASSESGLQTSLKQKSGYIGSIIQEGEVIQMIDTRRLISEAYPSLQIPV